MVGRMVDRWDSSRLWGPLCLRAYTTLGLLRPSVSEICFLFLCRDMQKVAAAWNPLWQWGIKINCHNGGELRKLVIPPKNRLSFLSQRAQGAKVEVIIIVGWRRKWHPTPVLLPGKVGHDWMTSLSLFTFLHWRRKCSCLENPRDGGAWWAAVYGVAQSRTQLK